MVGKVKKKITRTQELLRHIRYLEKHVRFLNDVIYKMREKNEEMAMHKFRYHITNHIDEKIERLNEMIKTNNEHYLMSNINECRTYMLETFRIVERMEKEKD